MPLKIKLLLIAFAALVAFGAVVLSYSLSTFNQEVNYLYTEDFSERLRNIGVEYLEVDAVSGASEAADAARQDILDRLERKYVDLDDTRAQPWIINGDGEQILNFGDPLPESLTDSVFGKSEGTLTFEGGSGTYWTWFFYFEPWDWYTGYRVREDVMRAEVTIFTRNMVLIILASVILISGAVYLIVSRTLKPLDRVGRSVAMAAKGDLTGDPEVEGTDEIGRLAGDVRRMIASIADLVRNIGRQADESGRVEKDLFESSSIIISAAQQVGSGTREIQSRIDGLKSGISGGSKAAGSIDSEAGSLARVIAHTSETVVSTTARVDSLVTGVQDIGSRAESGIRLTDNLRTAVRDGVQQINRVGEAVSGVLQRLDEIQELASMIGDLGDQTNLLAMNASIEAAHAGDAGRGFSVVAGEIRKLAEQTGTRASGIDQVISGVTEAVGATEASSRDASEAIRRIDSIADEMTGFLGDITHKVGELDGDSRRLRQDADSLRADSRQTVDGSAKMTDESRNLQQAVEGINATADELASFTAEVERRLAESEGSIQGMESLVKRLHSSMARLVEEIERFSV